MNALLAELRDIVAEAESSGIDIAVIGAFALRTYLANPEARLTNDLDLVIRSASRVSIEALLRARGFTVYTKGPWIRGEREHGTPKVVDVALDAIVDLASFEAYPIDPSKALRRAETGGPRLPVLALEDLLAQKLIAAREKDALDVILIALNASLDVAKLRDAIDERDVEVPVRRGYLEVLAAARSGRLTQLWRERLGGELSPNDLDRAVVTLQTWFGESP